MENEGNWKIWIIGLLVLLALAFFIDWHPDINPEIDQTGAFGQPDFRY